jgi:hypothetical protein
LRAWTAIVQPGRLISSRTQNNVCFAARKETLPLAPNQEKRHMKPQFYEDYSTENLDPLAPSMEEDFDWDELYERFGEVSDRQMHDEQMERINKFVRELFQWVVAIDLNRPNSQTLIGRRFIALAWVLNPALFEGTPSASKLAESLGIARKANLWELTGEVSRHFKIINRGQSHAWNRNPPKQEAA